MKAIRKGMILLKVTARDKSLEANILEHLCKWNGSLNVQVCRENEDKLLSCELVRHIVRHTIMFYVTVLQLLKIKKFIKWRMQYLRKSMLCSSLVPPVPFWLHARVLISSCHECLLFLSTDHVLTVLLYEPSSCEQRAGRMSEGLLIYQLSWH